MCIRDRCCVWMRHNTRVTTQYDIVELPGRAYLKVKTDEIAVSVFRATDIFPANRQTFSGADFVSTRILQLLPHDTNGEGRDENASILDDGESSNATNTPQQLVRSFDQGSGSSETNDTVRCV